MIRSLVIKFAMVIGVFLASGLAHPASTAGQDSGQNGIFTISPGLRRGDVRSDGAAFFDCDDCDARIAGARGLNDSGEVVIFGFGGDCIGGLYVVSGRTGFRVADVCHPSDFGRFSLFAGANINNAAQVALNMGPAIGNTIVDMILLYSNGQLNKIAAQGDQIPMGTILGGNCGFGPPGLNNNGHAAFFSCTDADREGRVLNSVLVYSGGTLRTVVRSGDASPLGGVISLAFGNAGPVHINDNGDVLFAAGQIDEDITSPERFGLFLATAAGIKKIELSRDTMPNGSTVADNSLGAGTLNNNGDVVFGLRLTGNPKVGYFLYSNGQTKTIILDRETTPIGGTFNLTQDVEDPFGPRINDSGTVALMANIAGGDSPEAVFLASPTAIVKVVAVGDRLPTGEKIRSINSFALNNLGQVAFFANGSASVLNPKPLGVYLATPSAPSISSIKLKRKKGSLQLTVNGNAMITNDTVIEINGAALDAIDYPPEARQRGGATTQVTSRDPRLDQLIPEGQMIQVSVYNPLTNLRSTPVSLTK